MNRELILERLRVLLAQILPEGASAFLFGSQARGDFSAHSDWDILILFADRATVSIEDRGRYTLPIYTLAAEENVEINPVLYSASEWQARSFTPFYKNVESERLKIWG